MERHKCKLCLRTFANGRALGGHMKAHLATLPLPPKPQPLLAPSFSHSSFSSSSEEEEAMAHGGGGESDEKALIYVLRENPKKSLRLSDPEFSSPASVVIVQDRESETESKNPTRRRSKRTRKPCSIHIHQNSEQEQKKPKLSLTDSPTDPEPVSSVSNTSPEEDVAMCLMMLSRDTWKKNDLVEEEEEEVQRSSSVEKSKGFKRVRGKQQCDKCGKTFRSSRALGSHKSICFIRDEEAEGAATATHKIFQCPFCPKVFGSGQALGGHKRSHLYPSPSIKDTTLIIDLNLPATPEEEEENDVDLSVVSDA